MWYLETLSQISCCYWISMKLSTVNYKANLSQPFDTVDRYPVRFCSSVFRNQFATTTVQHETRQKHTPHKRINHLVGFISTVVHVPAAKNRVSRFAGATRHAYAPLDRTCAVQLPYRNFKVAINGNLHVDRPATQLANFAIGNSEPKCKPMLWSYFLQGHALISFR